MTRAPLMLALVIAALLAASWLLPVARGAQRPARAYALLANGQVVAISVATGEVLATQSIGEPPQFGTAAPLLARHGDVLFAVTPRLLDQELVQLDPADLAVRERLALPADVEFTALVITRSGVPHLLGDRAGAPVLVTLRDGALSAPIELRPAARRDWSISGAALSSDDRRLAVMYHGRNSTGADVVDLASGTREPCPRAVRSGCLSIVHGTAAFAGGALVGTAGTSGLIVYRRNGKQDRVVDTELPRNHLMAMARDASTGIIVASVDCMVGRAVSIVNLERNSARMRRTACGDAVAVADGVAAIAGTDRALRGHTRPAVYLVDIRSGRRLHAVRTFSPIAVAF